MESFSERLIQLRKSASASQSVLANAVGITERALRSYETAGAQPRLDVARRIADYFDVSLDYLVGRSNDPERRP